MHPAAYSIINRIVKNACISLTIYLAAFGVSLVCVAAPKPIVIGAVLPLSGGLEVFGEQARVGIELAVTQVNAAGGIQGRPLEIIFEDNKTDPETALRRTIQLIRTKKVLAVLGPIASSARDAMMPAHLRYKTPLLYATNYEGGLCNRYFFSFNTVPSQELNSLLPALSASVGKSFYLVGTDYVWPHRSFEQAEKIIREFGGKIAATEYVPFGTLEFAALINRILESDARVVLKAIPGADGIAFAKQAQALGLSPNVALAYLGLTESYLAEFEPNQGQGMWAAVPFSEHLGLPTVAEFVANARAHAGMELPVSHYLYSHYNAVHAVAAALKDSEKITKRALIDGLRGLRIQTPAGPMAIDPDSHHATLNMYLVKAVGAQLTTVERLGPMAPLGACDKAKRKQ